MKISLNWLKDFVEFDKKLSIKEIAWKITEAAAEIERMEAPGKHLEKVVAGKITEAKKHPNADKLQVCTVDVGSETLQIVCGGKNAAKGMMVAVALPGAQVKWQGGELMEIKKVELRGVESTGMICGAEEIGLEKMFPPQEPHFILDLKGIKAKPGQEIAQVLGLDDIVLDIDNHAITHRPDLFSHYGMARECVALGLAKWKKALKNVHPSKLTGKAKLPVEPTFKNKKISKNYFSTVIEGLETKESPSWIKARLQAVGIRSINAIVDITNVVMMEIGQPCHAFDLRLIEGKKFQHRLSEQGEKLTTLDGVERTLPKDIIVVQSGSEIVDLCGIMGAQNSEIKPDTTEVYLHVCHYDNVLIRKAMISLGHRTDAGTIFEKNLEPERAQWGYIRALELFQQVFPEAKFKYETFHHQQEASPKTALHLPHKKIQSHLGIDIPVKKSQKILEDLGFEVKVKKDAFEVIVPSWRSNGVKIPEDLVEEIVRIFGYSNVPGTPPTVELATPVKNHKRHTKRTLQNILVGLGFQEEANYSFLSEELLKKIGYNDHSDLIEVANPVSEDFRFMRPNFLSYLLNNLSRNELLEAKQWRTFEMGAVYKRQQKEVIEQHLMTLLISSSEEDFFQLKGVVENLFQELALSCELTSSTHLYAHPKKCLAVVSGEKIVGHLYELHPMVKRNFKIRGNVVLFEANLGEIMELKPLEVQYQEINRNPMALLDISVVVDSTTMVSDIEKTVRSIEPGCLKKIKLMDVYQGASVGEGKKSITFSLSYQHPERTFHEKEIQSILESLIKKLEEAGGTIRR
ncbi:MAG: phenylalanine--tRNA ligase subunit beta [Candidatus Altimarinota bacterium]